MTERKPDGISWESWTERLIQEGQRTGAFDRLPGQGRPIDGLDRVHDEMWWVKRKLRDEEVTFLPPTIAIRAERAEAIEAAMAADTESEVREHIETVNVRIRYLNSHATAGPPSTVVVIDPEVIVDRWRHARPTVDAGDEDPALADEADAQPIVRRRRWHWRRLRRTSTGRDIGEPT